MDSWFFQVTIEGKPISDELYDSVAEIIVEDNGILADVFTIRLAVSKLDSGEWEYLNDERFDLFNEVSIRAGFENGVKEFLIEGYITQIRTHFDSAEGKSYLEINGMDPTVLMNLEEKVVAWQDMKDSEIAQEIFTKYDFTPKVDDTSTVHKQNDCTVIQKGTDIQFLRSLARRNGFECYVETASSGEVMGYFRKPVLDETPQKDLAIHFDSESNLVYFRPQIDSLKPLVVGAAQIDIKNKEMVSEVAGSPQFAKLGKNSLQDLIESKLSSLVVPKDSVSKIQLKNQQSVPLLKLSSQAVLDEGSWFVTAQGEINSEAYQSILKAKRIVLVKGAGRIYSGKYYVSKVSHIFTKEEYVQRFEARRNALELDGSEKFGSNQWITLI